MYYKLSSHNNGKKSDFIRILTAAKQKYKPVSLNRAELTCYLLKGGYAANYSVKTLEFCEVAMEKI